MIPKSQVQEILRIAEGKSTISTQVHDGLNVGDSLRQSEMGGFNLHTWEVVGFVSAKALFIHDNDPRYWEQDWQEFGDEHINDIGVLLKLKSSVQEMYTIRNLDTVANEIKRQKIEGLSPVTPLG